MHVHITTADYSKVKKFNYLLASDLHIGSKCHDRKLLKSEFDEAAKRGAKIFIAGDWGEFIISGDRKRYSPSGDKYGADNAINQTIDEAFEFLRPYASLIEFIGTGNHESALSKFHGIDPTQSLVALLNHAEKTNIRHGQYSGFVRFRYVRGNKSHIELKSMYYNHGQGGSAEISKGLIDINRHMTTKFSDIVWLGHKHTKVCIPCENVLTLNSAGDIVALERKGIITGAYVKTHGIYDAQKDGYKNNFGEEKMRGIQSTGGYFLSHEFTGDEIKTRIEEP